MDAEHLDFPDATFDRVLCGFGVMFFPNQNRALGEFRRVMKPGGRVAVSTWRVTQTSELDAVLSELGMTRPRQPGWTTEPADLARLWLVQDSLMCRWKWMLMTSITLMSMSVGDKHGAQGCAVYWMRLTLSRRNVRARL